MAIYNYTLTALAEGTTDLTFILAPVPEMDAGVSVVVSGLSVTAAVVQNLIPVTTLDQFNAMRYDLDGDGVPTGTDDEIAAWNAQFSSVLVANTTYTGYAQQNALDFAGTEWENPTGGTFAGTHIVGGWPPIANYNGVFDGGGYTISNLFIDRGTEAQMALFSFTRGIFKNSHLRDVNVSGHG